MNNQLYLSYLDERLNKIQTLSLNYFSFIENHNKNNVLEEIMLIFEPIQIILKEKINPPSAYNEVHSFFIKKLKYIQSNLSLFNNKTNNASQKKVHSIIVEAISSLFLLSLIDKNESNINTVIHDIESVLECLFEKEKANQ